MKQRLIIITAMFIAAILTVFIYHLTQQSDINYYRGRRFFLAGYHKEAIPFYERSIREGSKRSETYRELGYSYLWTGRPEEAIHLFERVAAEHPEDLDLMGSLADAYAWNRDHTEAIRILKHIIGIDNSPRARKRLAEVYLWSGLSEKAKAVLEPMAERAPGDKDIQLLWGRALYYSGDNEKASRVLEGLLRSADE